MLMYTLYAKVHLKIEWRFERSTIYTLFSNKQIVDYDNGTADVTKCISKFFCNTRRPNVKTWRLAELNYPLRNSFLKLFGQKFDNRRADQNLSAAAACRIYRRRRRTGGGAHVWAVLNNSQLTPVNRCNKKVMHIRLLSWLSKMLWYLISFEVGNLGRFSTSMLAFLFVSPTKTNVKHHSSSPNLLSQKWYQIRTDSSMYNQWYKLTFTATFLAGTNV